MESIQEPSTPPRTPQKSNHHGQRQGQAATVSESASKPRSKGRNRPRNVVTSPPVKNDRGTPPINGVSSAGLPITSRPSSTPSTAAYAGATFHASPAPSALPIPSFYSKSVPDSPGIKPPTSKREDSTSNSSDSPTPPVAVGLAAQTQREESPLDLFFKADREEKARARSASAQKGMKTEFGPFQPPPDSPQNDYRAPGSGPQSRVRNSHFAGGPASGMFAMELDGTNSPGKPYGPAFSTPYHERINAARSASSPPEPSSQSEPETQVDRSQALKAYLFSGPRQDSANLRSNEIPGKVNNKNTFTSDSALRHTSNPVSAPRNLGQPARPHSNSFHFIPDAAVYNTSSRAGPRSSGLRQEVIPAKSPTTIPTGVDMTSQSPFNTPSRSSKDSSSKVPTKSALDNLPLSQNSVVSSDERNNDIKSMENSLRRILNLGPSDNASTASQNVNSFTTAPITVQNYTGRGATSTSGI